MATTNDTRLADGTIGIIGGMGPLASAEFLKKLVLAIGAADDASYPRIVLDSPPDIPDRSAHILGTGPDPLPAMAACAKRLESGGATVLALASMNAHAYLDGLRAAVGCELASVFDSIQKRLDTFKGLNRVGVMATTGTIKAKLFDRYLPELRLHYSDDEAQERFVNEAVFGPRGIKAGVLGEEPRRLLKQAAARLVARGAELIIVACAEMNIVLRPSDAAVPIVDPMQFLAEDLAQRFKK